MTMECIKTKICTIRHRLRMLMLLSGAVLASKSMSIGQYFSCPCSIGCLKNSSCNCTARLSKFDETNQVMSYLANEEIDGVS